MKTWETMNDREKSFWLKIYNSLLDCIENTTTDDISGQISTAYQLEIINYTEKIIKLPHEERDDFKLYYSNILKSIITDSLDNEHYELTEVCNKLLGFISRSRA